ncbi:MAG TPA: YibE/F family protein [Acidimicrobiales bacterium]|nr:YibE/F family protein [Acidimicrobiales bacterium]
MAHTHSHDLGGPSLAGPRARRAVIAALAVAALATLVGLVLLWPGEVTTGGGPDGGSAAGFDAELLDATVTAIEPVPCTGVGDTSSVRCELVRAELTEGPDRGAEATFELVVGGGAPELARGDRIVVSYTATAPPELAYQLADFQRTTPLLVLAALFGVSVVALGRWRGLRALIGVGVSLAVLGAFLLPALLDGRDPLLTALVGAAAIAFVSLFLAHGVNVRTAVALLGALVALGITGALGAVFITATRLTGLADEDATLLRLAGGSVDAEGLLLAGIIIGAMGVLDDVTVTQVATTWELKRAAPGFGPLELYRRAVRVGRDHIASTVNTLVLAYAGASLPLLLLFTQVERSVGDVITGEVVATEVVRTLVGSIGLIAAVPLTTALAALVLGGAPAPGPDGTVDEEVPAELRRPRRRRRRRDPFWDDLPNDEATGFLNQ